MKEKIMNLVVSICNTDSTNCRSLNKVGAARKLMDFANIPNTAEIQEIPLDWNNQVVILFLMPDDINYYSLFAGIGNDGNFYFELSITGILDNNEFHFFPEDKILPINYFLRSAASMALCEGRHAIPEAVDGAIFGNTLDPLDIQGMEDQAERKLENG